jgi:hypothetical protein
MHNINNIDVIDKLGSSNGHNLNFNGRLWTWTLVNTAWKSDGEIPQTVVQSHFGRHFDESDQ